MTAARLTHHALLVAMCAAALPLLGCWGPPKDYMPPQQFRAVDHATGQPLEGVTAKQHSYRVTIGGPSYRFDATHGPTGLDGVIVIDRLSRHVSHVVSFYRTGYRRTWASIEGRNELRLADEVSILAPADRPGSSGWPDSIVEATGIIEIPMYREGEPTPPRAATRPTRSPRQ